MSGLGLALEEIEIDPSSYVDPQGFVFRHDGQIYRCIYNTASQLFLQLLEDGQLTRWQESLGLVETRKSDLVLKDHPDALIVHHRLISPMTYCVEWCPSMLKDSALSITELLLDLADHDLTLQDAYPWNIAFDGTNPIYLDLTSIAPANNQTIWQAYDQFRAFFLRPLALAYSGNGRVARALLQDNIGGVTLEEFYGASSASYKWLHPGLTVEYALNNYLKRRENIRRSLTKKNNAATRFKVNSQIRHRFFMKLDKTVRRFKVPPVSDIWKSYYDEIPAEVDTKAKVDAISQILKKLSPQTVLDLGCNTGLFSILAAQQGAKTVSVDMSESCIEQLYGYARKHSLAVTPVVSNLACPTPPYGFMGKQFPGLLDRVKSDTVLCLAVMHHLHITARQSFGRIADLVSSVTQKNLIFEFVGLDDDNIALLPLAREIGYSLDTVVTALSRHFSDIEVQPSDRPTRKLLLCRK
tara:strand:- start:55166 stop:56569 length:1404 start_codon:yes stop_codon:yes gene_type:complete